VSNAGAKVRHIFGSTKFSKHFFRKTGHFLCFSTSFLYFFEALPRFFRTFARDYGYRKNTGYTR
jgi:hypothetical protein